jgi:hypothetical protein
MDPTDLDPQHNIPVIYISTLHFFFKWYRGNFLMPIESDFLFWCESLILYRKIFLVLLDYYSATGLCHKTWLFKILMDRSGINMNGGLQKNKWLITLLASIFPNLSLPISWQSLRYFYAAICPYVLSCEDNQSRHLKIIVICKVLLLHY